MRSDKREDTERGEGEEPRDIICEHCTRCFYPQHATKRYSSTLQFISTICRCRHCPDRHKHRHCRCPRCPVLAS